MSNKVQIYLAGASLHEIDLGQGWRNKVTTIFDQISQDAEIKIKIINPLDHFDYSNYGINDKQIKEFFMDQILHSRIVLVNLNNSNNSCGTCMELQYAQDNNIPIIGFGTDEIYPWAKVNCQVVHQSLLQAIDYIKEHYLL